MIGAESGDVSTDKDGKLKGVEEIRDEIKERKRTPEVSLRRTYHPNVFLPYTTKSRNQ